MKDYTAILNGDAGLAGIQSAVQGRAAYRVLHRQIEAILSAGCRAGPLHLTRVKYKPSRRLSAYYTTSIIDENGALVRTVPLVITWGGTVDGGQPRRDSARIQQMEDEAGRRGLLAPFVRLCSDTLEQGARLEVWPLDPDFPQLIRLGAPDYADTLFRSARVGVSLAPGNCVHVTPVRYRPGERHVLRFSVPHTNRPIPYYAKLYREPEAAARAERITTRAANWLDANLDGFYAVRPVGMSLEDAVLLYPHADGKPLSQQLRRSPDWLSRQLRLVGAVLETLHRGPASLTADLEENTLEKEVQVIRRASEHVQLLLPETGKKILSILDRAEAWYAHLPQEGPTFTHSDFKADHLLISRSGMALIDFDTCALADPAFDIGKFLADLEWWYEITHTTGVKWAQQEFLAGYSNLAGDGRLDRASVFHALILVKIAIRRVRLNWKDWAAVTTRLVARAEGLFP